MEDKIRNLEDEFKNEDYEFQLEKKSIKHKNPRKSQLSKSPMRNKSSKYLRDLSGHKGTNKKYENSGT